jgi:hypothetical protein
MTGPVNFRVGFRPVRRDKLLKERVHDTYRSWGKLPEPTACPDCGAVYHKGHWQWLPRPEKPHEQVCPACHRVRDRFPAGYVTLGGDFLGEHRDEIVRLIRHHGERAQREHPLDRIIAVEDHDGGLLVTTTDIHLARGIGEALEDAYQGTLDFHYNDAENLLRVDWRRSEKTKRPRR